MLMSSAPFPLQALWKPRPLQLAISINVGQGGDGLPLAVLCLKIQTELTERRP